MEEIENVDSCSYIRHSSNKHSCMTQDPTVQIIICMYSLSNTKRQGEQLLEISACPVIRVFKHKDARIYCISKYSQQLIQILLLATGLQRQERLENTLRKMSTMSNNCAATTSSNVTMSDVSNNNNEQPQTKRQRIEKIKSSKIGRPKANGNIQSSEFIDSDYVTESNKTKKKLNCSSLSSSTNSITTPSNSLNNSPTSTPISSRAASLSQLLIVQNLPNILPQTSETNCGVTSGSSPGEKSADEVDRVSTHNVQNLMSSHSIEVVVPTLSNNSTLNSQQQHPQLLANNIYGLPSIGETFINEMREFEDSLTRQCLCGVSERTLRKPFQSHYSQDANGMKRIANLCEWPTNKLLQFLSNLQLLFDIYLKQNSKGFICARIMDVCDALIRNDHNLIDEIIVLASYRNSFVQFLAGRVLASFLVIAKQEMNDDWLKKLVDNLFNFERLNHVAVQKIHFSLEIIKRIVEWKDVDLHPLEDEIESETETRGNAGISIAVPATYEVSGVEPMLETHSFLHFHAQQPTLETNYFAVHFRRGNEEHQHELDVDASEEHITDSHNRNSSTQLLGSIAHYEALGISASLTNMPINNADDLNSFLPQNAINLHNYQHTQSNNLTQYPSISSSEPSGCQLITLTDSESFDTTHLKCITIKILENKWPALVKNMSALIANHLSIENAENCVLNFLQLWENIISVKANLSIVETLPFYAHLDKFELLLNQHLSCTIYKQMLCLFNEALCYGSTLALQDMLPDETCLLAHQIVRHVKDFRILESLPRRQPENIVSLIGFKRRPVVYAELGSMQSYIQQSQNQFASDDAIEMDKTILQKMVLLVLKSIAVTVKEIRSDSSDSSIDSTDYDAFQDMVLIERSIRDVLSKLESFIKNTLEFHPECHFSKILIHLFDDQDDHLIEAMVCTLDVTSGISFRNNAFPELVAMLNPVYTFLEFLNMISNSSDLLLDLLVSNETCFLLYLLRFLKYIRMNWEMLEQSCLAFGNGSSLDDAMSVLIRLRLKISRLVSRQLYPYDISPVLRLLESCESLYEGNELS